MNRSAIILTQLETSLSADPQALAQRFGVSVKTIAANIAQLNRTLGSAASIRLQRDRYRLLVLDADAFLTIRDRIVNDTPTLSDRELREEYILARLMRSDEPVSIEQFALSMNVGRTTAVTDLSRLRKRLAEYQVRIEGRTHVGLQLTGPELGIRMAVLRFAYAHAYQHYQLGAELEHAIFQALSAFRLSNELSQTLHRWATVMLDRYLNEHPLAELPSQYDELAGGHAHDVARAIAARIEPLIGEKLPDQEVLFLAVPVSGMRTPTSEEATPDLPSTSGTGELVERVFERIRQTMDVQFDPSDLVVEFTHHVAFMINRMRYSLHLDNAVATDQIRAQFPVAFRMARITAEVIAEDTGLVMDDTELSLASTYFQVFLEDLAERHHQDLRVAIVTDRGPGAAHLLHLQLSKVLPVGTRFALWPSVGHSPELDRCDLVVSTPGLHVTTSTHTIELSEVFDQNELLRKLDAMRLTSPSALSRPATSPAGTLLSLIDDDRVIPLPAETSYTDAVDLLVSHLEDRGMVAPSFRKALAEREQRSSMVITEGVAFPHCVAPNATELVCALGLVPRGDEEPGLRLIFLMAVPDKKDYDDSILIRVYDEVIRLSANPVILNKISRFNSYEQLFYLMESASQESLN